MTIARRPIALIELDFAKISYSCAHARVGNVETTGRRNESLPGGALSMDSDVEGCDDAKTPESPAIGPVPDMGDKSSR